MSFLILSSVDIDFSKRELWWRFYTIEKVLLTTKQVKLVGKKEFAATALDSGHEIFVVHVASYKNPSQEGDDHPSYRVQIAALVANKAPTSIFKKYSDFADIFYPKLALELLKHTGINDYAFKLVDDWQPSYGPIYSLKLVELETLKTYIKTNLANSFIRLSKSLAGAPIFFDKKPDRSLQLCVDYWGLNNLTIKNQYLLPLVRKSLDWLEQAQRFIQLKLTSAYYLMRIRKGDEWKTAFWIRYGHFEYQMISFGLTNALATF